MSIAIETPGLTETQRQIVELARDFARTRIEPFAAEWDRRAHFDRAVIDELGRLGFLGLSVPEEYDGMGLDTVTYLLALAEIAAADASVAVSLARRRRATAKAGCCRGPRRGRPTAQRPI